MHFYPILLRLGSLLTLLFTLHTAVQAQNSGIYVTFEGGPSFPLGNFSAANDASTGYAQLGINGTASVGFRFHDFLALGGKFAFTQNPVAPGATFLGDSPWRSNFFMGELTGNYPFNSSFSLEAQVSGGYAETSFPEGDFEVGGLSVYNEGGKGTGFGYGASLGLRYFLDDYISFKLGANYLGAQQELQSSGNAVPQSINLLTTNFGITLTMD